MNLKGTLRRTLALLLVLFFALSNMGLAEMAEQLDQYTEGPEIFDEYVETENTETEADADAAAPAEEEAPAEEAAPTVAVDVYALDEHTMFADAEGTNYDGELGYQWEVAADGEWVALEGETDAYLTGDEAEMAGQTYRCIVTAGETEVASDGVVSDPSIFADEAEEPAAEEAPEAVEESVEMAAVNAGPEIKIASKGNSVTYVEGTDRVVWAAATEGSKFTLTVPEVDGDTKSYEWTAFSVSAENEETAESTNVVVSELSNSNTGDITVKAGDATISKAAHYRVKVKATSHTVVEPRESVLDFYVLPELVAGAYKTVVEKTAAAKTVVAGNGGIGEGEKVTFGVALSSGTDFLTFDSHYGKISYTGKSTESGNAVIMEADEDGTWIYDQAAGVPKAAKGTKFTVEIDSSNNIVSPKLKAATTTTAQYGIIPYASSITTDDGETTKSLSLTAQGPGSDEVTLQAGAETDGTLGDDSWTDISWTAADNNWGDNQNYVTIENGSAFGKIKFTANSTVPATHTVVVTVTAKYRDSADKQVKDATFTYNVTVLAADISDMPLSLSNLDFDCALKTEDGIPIIGQPQAATDEAKTWAQVNVKLVNTPLAAYPVTYAVDTDTDANGSNYIKSSNYDKATATGTIIAKALASNTAADYGGGEETNGHLVAMTATVAGSEPGTNDKTVKFQVLVKPAPEKVELDLLKNNGDKLKTIEPSPSRPKTNVLQSGSAVLIRPTLGRTTSPELATIDKYGPATKVSVTKLDAQGNLTDETTDVSVNSDGYASWYARDLGDYMVTAWSATGLQGKGYVHVQAKPTSIEIVAKEGKNRIFVDGKQSSQSDKVELFVTGKNGTNTDVYLEDIEWALGVETADASVMGDHYWNKPITNPTSDEGIKDKTNAFYLDAGKSDYPKAADLKIKGYASTGLTAEEDKGKTLIITAKSPSTDQVKYEVKTAEPASSIDYTELQAALAAAVKLEGNDVLLSGSNYLIAQGDTGKLTVTYDTEKVDATDALEEIIEDYPIYYKLTGTFAGVSPAPTTDAEKSAEMVKWISFNEESGEIKAIEAGTNNKLSLATANEGDAYKEFTLAVGLAGIGYKAGGSASDSQVGLEFKIHVVPVPDHVEIYLYENSAKKTTKPPKSVAHGDSIMVYGKLIGPALKTGDSTADTAGELPEITVSGNVNSGAVDGTPGVWSISPTGDGTSTISTSNYGSITKDWTFFTIEEPYGKKDKGELGSQTCTNGTYHSWHIVVAGASYTASKGGSHKQDKGEAGHFYVCTKCGKETDVMPHTEFWVDVPENTGDPEHPYTPFDATWKAPVPAGYTKNGDVKCIVCQYACEHGATLDGATRVNDRYHEGYCTLCDTMVKEAHKATGADSSYCDICNDTSAKATFYDENNAAVGSTTVKSVTIVKGDEKTYEPYLVVENVSSFTVDYEPKSGSGNYITVNPDGTVSGTEVTPEGSPAVLLAHIHTVGKSGRTGELEAELPIAVKNKVTGFTFTSTQADTEKENTVYVIECADDTGVVEIEAVPNESSPDLRNYKWDVGGTAGSNIVFCKPETTGEGYNELSNPDEIAQAKTQAKIWIKVKSVTAGVAGNDAATLTFTNTDDSSKKPKLDLIVDVLNYPDGDPASELNDYISIDSDKVKSGSADPQIVQGSTVGIALQTWNDADNKFEAFDKRYGSVTYTVKGKDNTAYESKLSPAEVKEWVEIKGDKLQVKGALENNILTADRKYVEFTVEATISLAEWTDSSKTAHKTIKGTQDFRIISKPAEVTIEQEVDVNGKATWTKVTGDIKVTEGDNLKLRAQVTNPASLGNNLGEVTKNSSVKFTWDPSNFDTDADGEWNADKTEPINKGSADSPEYTVTVKNGAGNFTIPVSCGDMLIDPIEVQVLRQYTKISLTPSKAQVGIGETEQKTEGVNSLKEVTITVDTEPKENIGDELVWTVYRSDDKQFNLLQAPNATSGKGSQDVEDVTLTKALNDIAGTQNKFFTVPDSSDRTDHDGKTYLIIRAEAKKSKVDGKNVVGEAVVNLFNYPAASTALELETAKTTDNTKTSQTMTVNEMMEITKHGYIEKDGYGCEAGFEIEPEIAANQDGTENTNAQIVHVGDKVYVKALAEGKADLVIHPYSSNTVGQTIKLTISKAASEIVLDTAKLEKEAFTINKGDEITISTSAFTAYRDVTSGTTTTKQIASQAAVTLTAKDPKLVEIKRDNAAGTWTVKALEAGSTELYGSIGEIGSATEVKSDKSIPLTIRQNATGIEFFYTDTNEKVGSQIVKNLGDTGTIKLTAKAVPDFAEGTVTINPLPAGVTYKPVGTDGVEVEIPATAGTVAITAQMINSAYDKSRPTDAVNSANLYGYVEIVVVDTTGGDEPGPVEPVGPTVPASLQINGKSVISVGETTSAVVINPPVGQTITNWNSSSAAVTVTGTGNTATITGVAPGTAEIQAVAGELIVATANVTVLSAPTELKIASPTAMSIGETVPVVFDYAGYDKDSPVEVDPTGVISIDYADEASQKIVSLTEEYGKFVVTGLKKGAANLKISALGGATASATITIDSKKKNTGFSIGGYANGTIYMEADAEKSVNIPVTFKPAGTIANLAAKIVPDDGNLSVECKGAEVVVTLSAGEAGDKYDVTLTREGFPTGVDQKFSVVVAEAADAATNILADVDKVGVPGAYETANAGSVNVVKGEKLQGKIVDTEGNPVAGDVTWSTNKAGKKYVTVTTAGLITAKARGSATVTAKIGSKTATITVNVANAPKTNTVKLEPASTTRTVAVGEEFKLGMNCTYSGNGKWYAINWSGMEPEENTDENNAVTYSFAEAGTAVATVATGWGVVKTVNFTVVAETVASSIILPEGLTAPTSGNMTVKAELDGYAELGWSIGGVGLTEKDQQVGSKKIKAKVLSNDEIQITTVKAAVGTPIEVSVTAAGAGITEPEKTTVTVDENDKSFPEGAKIVFDKNVIGVKESVKAHIEYADGTEGAQIPTGTISFKSSNVKGAGNVKTSGNVITGNRAGLATVTAYIGKTKTSLTEDIYVLSKSTLRPALKPTKMAENETIVMDVFVDGYDGAIPSSTEDKEYKIDTTGILSATSSDAKLVSAKVLETDEENENIRKFTVRLKAGDAVKTAKGKFTSATVTLKLFNSIKKTMKIQVVNAPEVKDVYVPHEIYIAASESVTLPSAVATGTDYGANFGWHFEKEDVEDADVDAAKKGLTLSDGKLVAKKATVGYTTKLVGELNLSEDETKNYEIAVTVGAKVTNKNQFKVTLPKTTAGVGEKLQAKVTYNAGYAGGNITWKSSKPAIATIDKKSGLIIAKKVGATTISAVVKGKTQKQALTIVAEAATSIDFDVDELPVKAGELVELAKHVKMSGGTSANDPLYESAYIFEQIGESAIVEEFDAQLGKVTISATAQTGIAQFRVTTVNGKYADILLVLGSTSGGTEPGPDDPEKPAVPASIEMLINNQPQDLTNGNVPSITLEEQQHVTPKIIVKDASGREIVDAKITWTKEDTNNCATLENGTLTAVHSTTDSTTIDTPVVVTAKVDGTELTAQYKVSITAVMSGEHMDICVGAEPVAETMITSTSVENAHFKLEDDLLSATIKGLIKIENLTPEYLKLLKDGTTEVSTIESNGKTGLYGTAPGGLFTIKAVKPGAGEIKITVTTGSEETNDLKKYEKVKKITVTELPTAADITVSYNGAAVTDKVVLGKTEPGDFVVTMPQDTFGKPAGWDIDAEVISIKDAANGKPAEWVPATDGDKPTVTVQTPTADGVTLNVKTATGLKAKQFRVRVTAFKTQTKDFVIEVVDGVENADHVKIETTPKATDATTINAGVGEKVSLSVVALAGKTWTKGLSWRMTTAEQAGVEFKTLDDGIAEVTSTKAVTIKVKPIRNGIDTSSSADAADIASGTETTNTEYTIVFKDQPNSSNKSGVRITYQFKSGPSKDDLLGSATTAPSSNTVKIGANERIALSVDFRQANCYSNEIRWTTQATSMIEFSDPNGAGMTIDAWGMQKSNGTFTVTANALVNSVLIPLGSVTIETTDAPTTTELKDSDQTGATLATTNDVYSGTMKHNTTGYYVRLDMGKATSSYAPSASFSLTCKNSKVKCDAVPGQKNVWKIYIASGDQTGFSSKTIITTLILSNKDLGITKQYNLKIEGT